MEKERGKGRGSKREEQEGGRGREREERGEDREEERASMCAKPYRNKNTFLKDFLNVNFAGKVGNRGNVHSVKDFLWNTTWKLYTTKMEL